MILNKLMDGRGTDTSVIQEISPKSAVGKDVHSLESGRVKTH